MTEPSDGDRGLRATAAVDERGVDVDLAVAPGEVVALLGPNGAGKSTVLDLVAGLLRPDRGRVVLDGETLADAGPVGTGRSGTWVPPHRRRTALLAQDPLLFDHLTALDNAAFAPHARGAGRAAARAAGRRWLQRVGVPDLADRRPAALSGGQAQRVALARALAAEPRLLLLDEPLAALDVGAAPGLRQLLRDVLRTDGRSALLVTHDPLDVLALADRVVVLAGGHVVEEGTAEGVLTTPRSAFSARLSGLAVLRGTATPEGLHLPDGHVVPVALDGCGTGGPGLVHLSPRDLVPAAPGERGHIALVVTGVVPRGETVTVRGADVDGWPGPLVEMAAATAVGLVPGDVLELRLTSATAARTLRRH